MALSCSPEGYPAAKHLFGNGAKDPSLRLRAAIHPQNYDAHPAQSTFGN
jgi:hypothetical protein